AIHDNYPLQQPHQNTLTIHTRFLSLDTSTTDIYTLSLHDALPIFQVSRVNTPRTVLKGTNLSVDVIVAANGYAGSTVPVNVEDRSEEHTSELQSRFDLVCRLLLEKKNKLVHSRVHSHTRLN